MAPQARHWLLWTLRVGWHWEAVRQALSFSLSLSEKMPLCLQKDLKFCVSSIFKTLGCGQGRSNLPQIPLLISLQRPLELTGKDPVGADEKTTKDVKAPFFNHWISKETRSRHQYKQGNITNL